MSFCTFFLIPSSWKRKRERAARWKYGSLQWSACCRDSDIFQAHNITCGIKGQGEWFCKKAKYSQYSGQHSRYKWITNSNSIITLFTLKFNFLKPDLALFFFLISGCRSLWELWWKMTPISSTCGKSQVCSSKPGGKKWHIIYFFQTSNWVGISHTVCKEKTWLLLVQISSCVSGGWWLLQAQCYSLWSCLIALSYHIFSIWILPVLHTGILYDGRVWKGSRVLS